MHRHVAVPFPPQRCLCFSLGHRGRNECDNDRTRCVIKVVRSREMDKEWAKENRAAVRWNEVIV